MKKNRRTHPHQATRLAAFLRLFWITDFTFEVALEYVDIRAALEVTGTQICPLDLLIAAQARSLGATPVTANAGEFGRVKGLKVLAWK